MSESLDQFVQGYIDCALWTGVEPPDGHPDKDHDMICDLPQEDLSVLALARMREDCEDFLTANEADLAAAPRDYEHLGHDFWLSRNGHGTGFWDRGMGELGDRLHAAAKVYGECSLYLGDDEQVHMV